MYYDIQRASMLKRLPAWILDTILLIILTTGFLTLWSNLFNVTPPINELTSIVSGYEEEFGGKLSVTEGEKVDMTKEEIAKADEISKKINDALNQNPRSLELLETIVTYIFAMFSLSVVCAYLILDFLVPLLLKNGQTLGKKCFGVALMRKDGIKVTPFMMFARTVLGKCTIETMIPLLAIVLMLFNSAGIIFFVGVAVLLAQLILPLATRNNSAIHDLMACTVAVDMSSQMIFNSVEEMDAYHDSIRINRDETPSE